MRQDHGDLLRSRQSTQEVVIEALQQVAKAIDGSLPAYVDQGHCGSAASAAAIRGIAVTRFIVRALMRVHWVYVPHARAWPFYPLTPRGSANVKTATLVKARLWRKILDASRASRANASSPMTLFYFRVQDLGKLPPAASPYLSYDVAADGRILALLPKQGMPRGLTIVQNWAAGLGK
jgi:hypothetical protein